MSGTSTHTKEWILSQIRPFAGARDEELRHLAAASEIQRIRAHRVFRSRSGQASHVHVVVHGLVRLGALSPEGGEVIFHFVREGGLIGVFDALSSGRVGADAVTVEDSTVMSINAAALRRFLSGNGEAALAMLEVVGNFAADAEEAVEDMAFLDMRARAAKRLLRLSRDAGRNGVRMSQQELAWAMCITRERLNKLFGEWRESGIIECARGRVTVCDTNALRTLAVASRQHAV